MLWTVKPGAAGSLQDQIAASVRRALGAGDLRPGDRLPPAQELAEALDVDRNTVLAAYRRLRDAGLLEFRRGRGVRVAEHDPVGVELDVAARDLVALAERHGYPRESLIRLIEELP